VAYCQPFRDMDDIKIREIINVNVSGLIMMTKHMLPLMQEGMIINISSGLGKRGCPGYAAYCASKFAVVGFTEALAGELKKIRVVAVCPGGVDTDMYHSVPSGRPWLKPEHIASKILEICSKPQKFRSGSAVEVYCVTDALAYLKRRYL
ncbi:MAG: SDR family oxidoreductase, partial [Candidatus Aenigmarchaeota archaeon]|nr:SDR family oxidoreductase [Candidatus Aenigmarchaeota archaeon]